MKFRLIVALVLAFSASTASAQETQKRKTLDINWGVVGKGIGKAMLKTTIDLTTTPPAILHYYAKMEDWETSQPFFRAGWLEKNPGFTETGLPYDVAMSFGDGKRVIRHESYRILWDSAVNNFLSHLTKQYMDYKYPGHKKLWTTVEWAERLAFMGFTAWKGSAQFIEQRRKNERLALQYGLK